MNPSPRWKIRRVCPIVQRHKAKKWSVVAQRHRQSSTSQSPWYRRRAQKEKIKRRNVSNFDSKMSSVNVCCCAESQKKEENKQASPQTVFVFVTVCKRMQFVSVYLREAPSAL